MNACRASAPLAWAGEAPALQLSRRDLARARNASTATGRGYNSIRRSRRALAITETELKLIAAPAIIGLRRTPKNG